MRYSQKDHSQEFCNGSVWMTMASLSPGSRDLYASSCREIALRHKSSEKSGAYWIKPSEQGPIFKVSYSRICRRGRLSNDLLYFCALRLTVMLEKAGP
jgi:hypothetical protein